MQSSISDSQKIIQTLYSPKKRVQLRCSTLGRTKQSFKAECDINTIVSRFLRTGIMDFATKNEARYGDTTGIDYQMATLTVARAKSLFNDLPAALRDRFENEPAKFLDFVQDDKNRAEALELGLLKPKEPSPEEEAPSPAEPAKTA